MMLYDVFHKGSSFDIKVSLPDPGPDIDYAICVNWDGHILRPRRVESAERNEALAEIKRRARALSKSKPDTTGDNATFGELLALIGLDIKDYKRFSRINRDGGAYEALAWVEMGRPEIPSDWIWV